MTMYTLYYTPGACSISPHIALRESGLEFTLDKVDLRQKKTQDGGDFFAINASGYVPALRLPGGEILTEGAVMVQFIADHAPESQLAPPLGTMARYRVMEWLNFIATELHKAMSPFYNPHATAEFKQSLGERMALRWARLADAVQGRPWVMGDGYTVADGYAAYVLRAWQRSAKQDLARFPELVAYYQRLCARPSIAAALAAEGLEP
jgi:glutathione S-transferase